LSEIRANGHRGLKDVFPAAIQVADALRDRYALDALDTLLSGSEIIPKAGQHPLRQAGFGGMLTEFFEVAKVG
jgi:hypothetical protein